MASRFHLFDTAVGRCAMAWRENVITRVLLPAENDAHLVTSIKRRDPSATPSAPPANFAAVIDKICALTEGKAQRFDGAPIDRNAIEPFAARVYDALDAVPFGATATYGEIAERLGDKGLARAVGAALGANPFPIIIPCHRVTASGGGMGGFSAPGGLATKRKLLEIEGAFAMEKLPLFGAP
jgi:methylated-DNA-[protein]-cysteine S-methyltransferase